MCTWSRSKPQRSTNLTFDQDWRLCHDSRRDYDRRRPETGRSIQTSRLAELKRVGECQLVTSEFKGLTASHEIIDPCISFNRFAEVIEFYEEDTEKKVHLRWYEHASKTILQEAHHPRELFPTFVCETVRCCFIFGKCVVKRCDPSQVSSMPRYKKGTPLNHFFYRLVLILSFSVQCPVSVC